VVAGVLVVVVVICTPFVSAEGPGETQETEEAEAEAEEAEEAEAEIEAEEVEEAERGDLGDMGVCVWEWRRGRGMVVNVYNIWHIDVGFICIYGFYMYI
jgi:hypothetical protein